MSEDQKSIVSNTVAFQDITNTDLIKVLRNARLIGFGENPHWVMEYYPIVRDVIRDLLAHERKVLVLLEHEYWQNRMLDDFIHGRSEEFLEYSFQDPDLGVLYGSGSYRFYDDLRKISKTFPNQLSCRHIDFFMTPKDQERSELVKSIDQGKWEISRDIKQYQKENNLPKFAETWEQFLTQEAVEGHHACKPDVTVLFAGSFHVSKQGGYPLGDVFVKSVMARLAESINEKPVSVRFSVLGGEFAKIEYRDGVLTKIPVSCDEWGQEDIQLEFRQAIRELQGNAFVTDLSNIKIPERLAESYNDWAANYDYLMTLRHASPDLPMNTIISGHKDSKTPR